MACWAGKKRSFFSPAEPSPGHGGLRSCPALLPCAWNVNQPAGKTKHTEHRRGQLTVHVHHPRGGAVLRRGHLRATLLIFAFFLGLVFLEETTEQKPSHYVVCVHMGARPRWGWGGGMEILSCRAVLGLHLTTSHQGAPQRAQWREASGAGDKPAVLVWPAPANTLAGGGLLLLLGERASGERP